MGRGPWMEANPPHRPHNCTALGLKLREGKRLAGGMAQEGRVSLGEEKPLFPPPCLTADCNALTCDPSQVTSTLIPALTHGARVTGSPDGNSLGKEPSSERLGTLPAAT